MLGTQTGDIMEKFISSSHCLERNYFLLDFCREIKLLGCALIIEIKPLRLPWRCDGNEGVQFLRLRVIVGWNAELLNPTSKLVLKFCFCDCYAWLLV